MSSQGVRGVDLSGYAFQTLSLRDASDVTRMLREQRIYANYNGSNTSDDKNAKPTWLKFGNDFRLEYAFGRFKCTGCAGNAFSQARVGDLVPNVPQAISVTNCVNVDGVPACQDQFGFWNSSLYVFTAPATDSYTFTLAGAALQAHTVNPDVTCLNANNDVIANYNDGNTIPLEAGETIYVYITCGSNAPFSFKIANCP